MEARASPKTDIFIFRRLAVDVDYLYSTVDTTRIFTEYPECCWDSKRSGECNSGCVNEQELNSRATSCTNSKLDTCLLNRSKTLVFGSNSPHIFVPSRLSVPERLNIANNAAPGCERSHGDEKGHQARLIDY